MKVHKESFVNNSKKCAVEFKRGCTWVRDDPRKEQPKFATTEEKF